MTDYYLVWKNKIHPTEMHLIKCNSKKESLFIFLDNTQIKYTNSKKVQIVNIKKYCGENSKSKIWLLYQNNHTYEENYGDIVIFYGIKKSAINYYISCMDDIDKKNIGIHEMNVIIAQEESESDNSIDSNTEESEISVEMEPPSFINLNMDIANRESINIEQLLTQIKCDNKYIIHHGMVHQGREVNDVSEILFVNNYIEFCEMVIDFYKDYISDKNDLTITYKSNNNTSCSIYIYILNDFDALHQIFGVNEMQQKKIKTSINKSLKKIGIELK